MKRGVLHSICISSDRGQLKKEVAEARLITDYGIEGDGHAGDWDRQVTCLNYASVQKVNLEKELNAGPGGFAENLLIRGIDLGKLKVGRQLRIGDAAILQVSQIGKEDHPSVVTRSLGVSLLPYEGLFCRVVQGGIIRPGNAVEVI